MGIRYRDSLPSVLDRDELCSDGWQMEEWDWEWDQIPWEEWKEIILDEWNEPDCYDTFHYGVAGGALFIVLLLFCCICCCCRKCCCKKKEKSTDEVQQFAKTVEMTPSHRP